MITKQQLTDKLKQLELEIGKLREEVEEKDKKKRIGSVPLGNKITNIAPTTITAKSLLKSGLVGIWKNRSDIKDSGEFAASLRKRAQSRGEN